MSGIELRPMRMEDLPSIVEWNRDRGPEFVLRWAGPGNAWPVTIEDLQARLTRVNGDAGAAWFRIEMNGRLVGSIELLRMDLSAREAVVGRFLLDPSQTGKGYGTAALRRLCAIAFDEMGIRTLRLSVFDYNKAAISCYQKCGFRQTAQKDFAQGVKALQMERHKQ